YQTAIRYPPVLSEVSKINLDTLLLFGNGVTGTRGRTLDGLYKGGVYRCHQEFLNPARKIRVGVLNFCTVNDMPFAQSLQGELDKHKNNRFQLSFIKENIRKVSLEDLSTTEAKIKVETLVDEILQIAVDLVLVFLPQSDRAKDDSGGDSIYAWVSRRLLRRRIASQKIYEKTLRKPPRMVFQNVVLGILGKLGNLPFVLAESLDIADYFIGLDVSRRKKKNGIGSINACASVRLYGNRGEFIRYQIANDALTEGEEIPETVLQEFLPIKDFKNKKVLIYRDGSFRGNEINHLVAWGQAINAEFILVECAKSQIPRLHNVSNKKLEHPTRGLALFLSSREVILVTTQVSPTVGLPRPLRLRVRKEGSSVDIKTLVDTTLKLTLLHHGSLKDSRLPIPLFGADRIAYRRLQGIYPGELEGDKQYWL
ncbi:MAG: Piwi domain-containing protein, partial [Cyanobacteria bacterium J06558_2]